MLSVGVCSICVYDAFYDIIHTIEINANLHGIILLLEYILCNILLFTKDFFLHNGTGVLKKFTCVILRLTFLSDDHKCDHDDQKKCKPPFPVHKRVRSDPEVLTTWQQRGFFHFIIVQ